MQQFTADAAHEPAPHRLYCATVESVQDVDNLSNEEMGNVSVVDRQTID